MPASEAVVVFLRLPISGKVKTRIAATTSEAIALKIYQRLLDLTFKAVSEVYFPVFLFYEGGLPPVSERDSRYNYLLQTDGSLDQKIAHAFAHVLKDFNKVLIIGSDCPELSSEIIQDSFIQLESCDVVLGPAKDGGFYLLGCKSFDPQLLEDIQWSTSTVLDQFLFNIQKAGLSSHLLEPLSDIDTEEDWLLFLKRENPQ